MSDLTGKTALVTGSSDGIGKQTAIGLARLGMRVFVHGRDEGRSEETLSGVRAAVREGSVEAVSGDFGSLAQVRSLARKLEERTDRLDLLVNNAGVYLARPTLSADRYELTFAVNVLAPFLLTNLLRPLLERSAPARIVNVSSMTHITGRVDLAWLRREPRLSGPAYDGHRAYADSKLALVVLTRELARRLDPERVTANALHPGVVGTKMLRTAWGFGGLSPEEGAAAVLHVATAPELAGVTGAYFDRKRRVAPSGRALDESVGSRLWQACEEAVGAVEGRPRALAADPDAFCGL